MKCPRDGATLAGETYEGDVVVDRCPACGGIWLDAGELQTVQETLERDYSQVLARVDVVARAYELARQKGRPQIACPKCQAELHPREYAYCSQILIDTCAACHGVWLDAGELQALEQFFEQAAADAQAPQDGIRRAFIAGLWQHLR
jgi:hypothetical protein